VRGSTLAGMEHDTIADDVADDAGGIDPELIKDELIEDELLVEEISIDGMCGVY
jgi:mycofactocin precursor